MKENARRQCRRNSDFDQFMMKSHFVSVSNLGLIEPKGALHQLPAQATSVQTAHFEPEARAQASSINIDKTKISSSTIVWKTFLKIIQVFQGSEPPVGLKSRGTYFLLK